MTTMLEKAFAEASRLPDVEQDALARWLLEEIESERKWDNLFAESEDELGRLALEALSGVPGTESQGQFIPLSSEILSQDSSVSI